MDIIRLKPGREKSLLRRHPWVFAGAIDTIEGSPGSGDTVKILSHRREFLAWGAFSPLSKIRIRVWSWAEDEIIDPDFFHLRLTQAVNLRRGLKSLEVSNACRYVHGESDGLPGLIVDRYDNILVVQFLSAGAERWRQILVDLIAGFLEISAIYERSDADVRKLEGLPNQVGYLLGGDASHSHVIREHGLRYFVDFEKGHKTGFYLDQRNNRLRMQAYAQDKDILDCFSYTGGFLLNALVGGAKSVLAVDSSGEALKISQENIHLNNLNCEGIEWLQGDVFQVLRTFRDQRRSFDLIVLDPPKFAPTISQAEQASRGYKDINLLAFKLLRPGGILFTFSCSGGIDAGLFQKIVAGAALDAGVQAQILERLHQSEDHPISLVFPEGEYLKGLILRKMSE